MTPNERLTRRIMSEAVTLIVIVAAVIVLAAIIALAGTSPASATPAPTPLPRTIVNMPLCNSDTFHVGHE